MSRNTTDAAKKIELSWLKAQSFFPAGGGVSVGSLRWSSQGEPCGGVWLEVNSGIKSPYIQMRYRIKAPEASDTEWRSYDYKFSLEKLPCHYGGFRWFVHCGLTKNGRYCGRRVRILYSVGDYFGCRFCANLTYESCNLSGRYKGFLSIPDLDRQEAKVKRRYYNGEITRKYKRFLEMEEKFEKSFLTQAMWLRKARKKNEL